MRVPYNQGGLDALETLERELSVLSCQKIEINDAMVQAYSL
jgi:hypothetical protein